MKGKAKQLCKLYTNPTFNPASLWFCARYEMYSLCSKLYTNYTLRRFKPYTRTIHESLHRNYTFCFLNTNQRNQADETNESCVTKVTCVTCVTNVTCVTKGRAGDGVNGTSPRCHGSRVSSTSTFFKNKAFADGVASFLQADLSLLQTVPSLSL